MKNFYRLLGTRQVLIELLQAQSGLPKSKLLRLSETASRRYKVYTIDKRRGGVRTIAQPSKALKAVQRWLNKVLIYKLPVHECATAYKKGASIRKNAIAHSNTAFTLRMDFENFFPSFSSEHIRRFVAARNVELEWGLSDEDVNFVCAITTRNGFLTIGAPSSPAITNAMMYEFDNRIYTAARENRVVYTRYADDLFVSSYGPDRLGAIREEIENASEACEYADLRINQEKTAYLSRRYRRSITGLVITSQGEVSIGRKRKREVKALIHRYKRNELLDEGIARARGLVAFSLDAEPTFYESLCRKYGVESVEQLLGRIKRE